MKSSNIFWYSPEGNGYCTTCAMAKDPAHPYNDTYRGWSDGTGGYTWTAVTEHHDHFGAVECESCGLMQAYHNEPQMQVVVNDGEREFVKAEFHWYASSGLNWSVGKDILEALENCKRRDISQAGKLTKSGKRTWEIDAKVYRVPGPVTRSYKIDNYVPVVDGLEYIETVSY